MSGIRREIWHMGHESDANQKQHFSGTRSRFIRIIMFNLRCELEMPSTFWFDKWKPPFDLGGTMTGRRVEIFAGRDLRTLRPLIGSNSRNMLSAMQLETPLLGYFLHIPISKPHGIIIP